MSEQLPNPSQPASSFARAHELEHALKKVIRGEVRFDRGSRALYATDASNYRQVPIGLVLPMDAEDVAAAVATCRAFGAPVLPRGGGTSLAGQCCNIAVVFDFSKYMNRILEIDPEQKYARVQPGVVLDTLRDQAERHHLTFAPDPSTHSRCTLGGMIGNNSCGTHSLLGGKTVDNVEELKVLLYDGAQLTVGATTAAEFAAMANSDGRRKAIYQGLAAISRNYAQLVRQRFPDIPRRVSGYNLDQLLPEKGFHVARSLVGSEGTCVTVLEAKLRLIHSPRQRVLVGLAYPDVFLAADEVPEVLRFGPIGLEGFEGRMAEVLRSKGTAGIELLPVAGGHLLVEFGADDEREARARAQELMAAMERRGAAQSVRLYSKAEAAQVWKIREAGPRGTTFQPGEPLDWEGWEDTAVAPEKLGGYLRELRKLLDAFGYRATFYGHFGHACIHMRITFDLQSEAGIRRYSDFIDQAADLVVRYGGSLSGEHGDGQSRGALLQKMYGPELMEAFRRFKAIWDPDGKMNPRKIVDSYLPTENLRLGANYTQRETATHFAFPADEHSLSRATLRCIGIGACRSKTTGGMCPSYRVTMEEKHSTRGRAHLLWELLQGDVLESGWRNEEVREAMDLCLSCKACKTECPANVDVATYKAEFLSHYYQGRLRPLHAQAFAHIDRWAAAGARVAPLANFLSHAPGLAPILKSVLHIHQQRELPRFAAETFRTWARRTGVEHSPGKRSAAPGAGARVLVWPDTFTNYFHPSAGQAAVQVLREAGFDARVPQSTMCCGRPLYDFGMLGAAKRYLARILRELKAELEQGVPIVMLEPSCASVFRDELRNLFPDDPAAQRLSSQSFLFSEFLVKFADRYQPPSAPGRVLLHGHCHQKALVGMSHSERLLERMGAQVIAPEPGCCGMAGPFGFNKKTHPIAQSVGERVLLPAVRAAEADTLIVADGFSCREQIFQNTGRQPRHLAEVLCAAGKLVPGGSVAVE